ncbi:hypothetical protein [Parabacteroides sp. PF5-9]|uniref:hypothetical protein n=1 Tax=Parabacteroides sp. PF5-9 TaxID=1742404 RepID=UPI0024754637|nr:hypothetical protein [Parabacteroides sp. PF5-9]MDH6356289.1 cbb3-type cytochrome oxidase subunit 3 [Parabacteroides sp. PF5-9]
MNKQAEDIKAIREMMERSSKFLSLSGLSGILAGLTAIAGAAFAYFYLLRDPSLTDYNQMQELLILLADALIVLFISISFGIYFSWRKARKSNQTLLSGAAKRTLFNLSIPLIAGGIFCIILLFRGDIRMVIAGTLIFYGIALLNASKFTFTEIQYLGLTEIILGIAAALTERYGLLFWTIGFGLCHILYGFMMYRKYDLKKE